MNYTKVSLENWKRGEIFKHFIDNLRCVINITADINIGSLRAFCKSENYRFYPTFIYIVTKVINSRDEFKMGHDEGGDLIIWDEVFPLYTVFDSESEMITRLVTPYAPDFQVFYEKIVSDMDRQKSNPGIQVSHKERNVFDVSCLPWLHYKSCDLHVFDSGKYLAPFITWGKFEAQNGEYKMPLTMQIHHAVADGFHISRFFEDVQFQIKCLIER
ncbi:MAG: CatA-like O-acetyltransferase [Oscillospiraceae bacterium]|nr:CatA-like O-acetyltransferase [Oscillospiraceae bacterium]